MKKINLNTKIKTVGLAVNSKDSKFQKLYFERRKLKDNDVLIEIKYAGICHSDIHVARAEWGFSPKYPLVPGHEIAGVVIATGKKVKKFKIGDYAGVGCLVNSCCKCDLCKNDYQQLCEKNVLTFGGIDYFNNNENTQGGYSKHIVVDENFVIKVPKSAPLQYVAPLLCSGITTYSPIIF